MYEFNFTNDRDKTFHFIGIGGISMSGLAEILLDNNIKVQGSDMNMSKSTDRLILKGAKVYKGHNKSYIEDVDIVVYTDAVKEDNEEIVAAKEKGIPIINRASFLGSLMKNYKNRIVISGTHGKTSTTSMVSTIFNHTNLNPTIMVGGELDEIDGNVKVGSSDYFITEGCEYKANILKYEPTTAIILNVDSDHLDFFKDIDDVLNAFIKYVTKLDKDDYLIINRDCYGYEKILDSCVGKIISYGFTDDCTFKIKNIIHNTDNSANFTIEFNNEDHNVKINVLGDHNIQNATAAIASAVINNLPIDIAINNIEYYKGVHRRLEFKGIINDIRVYDDYAHHPTEIKSTLSAFTELKNDNEKIYAIFQPHTFTRTKMLLDQFGVSFIDADMTIITDIYAARETDDHTIHSKDLSEEINKNGYNSKYISSFQDILAYLKDNVNPGDIIVTIGAGNIYILGEEFLGNFENEKYL